jgi:hypothetical protein
MSKYAIGVISRSHQKGWAKRGIRERQYEQWFRSQKEHPSMEAMFQKRLELGFTREVAIAKRRKVEGK